MTSPFQPGQSPGGAAGASRRGPLGLPTPPKGWPVGSYPTYAEAQRAVDYLSDNQFPVKEVTIVGVDLMQVERVTGRSFVAPEAEAAAAAALVAPLLVVVLLALAPCGGSGLCFFLWEIASSSPAITRSDVSEIVCSAGGQRRSSRCSST